MDWPGWVIFTVVTILVSTPWYLKMRTEGGSQNENFLRNVRSLMLVPGIVAFGFRLVNQVGFDDINFGLGESPWLFLIAFLLPLLVEVFAILLSTRLGLARLDPQMVRIKEKKVHLNEGIGLLLGNQPQSTLQFAANLILTLAVATLVSLVFALGEEFGWRGYMQNQAIESLGLAWGLVMVGIGWAAWHIPLVIMGYRFQDYPSLGAYVFMPLMTISTSIVIGFFYWLSQSLWVAAILNASILVCYPLSLEALGKEGGSKRIRFIHIWLWAGIAGLCLALWASGVMGK